MSEGAQRRRVRLYDEDVSLGWFDPDEASLIASVEQGFDITQLFRLANGTYALWRWPKTNFGEALTAYVCTRNEAVNWLLEHNRDIPTDLEAAAERGNILNAALCVTSAPVRPPLAVDTEAPDQLVTLQQMASIVNKSKAAIEKIKRSKLPPPRVRGGKGAAHEWLWAEVRPILSDHFNRPLPEIWPADRFLTR